MAKIKPSKSARRNAATKDKTVLNATNNLTSKKKNPQRRIEQLIDEAADLLQEGQPDAALPLVEEALARLEAKKAVTGDEARYTSLNIPGRNLAAQIQMELGLVEEAYFNYTELAKLDPAGKAISAEPHLWLAQLSPEGGQDSIDHYTKACEILRGEVASIEETVKYTLMTDQLEDKKIKLSEALCSMAEVYLTDLSFQDDAERFCEGHITEALAISPTSASVLQTLASIRISQVRIEDAKSALKRSLELRENLPPDDVDIPDFPTRVSLARLLMEVEEEAKAFEVTERLVKDDDHSVEAWYLGGLSQSLRAQKERDIQEAEDLSRNARTWLRESLRLYDAQQYEDDRLRDHARELVGQIEEDLKIQPEEEDDWEDDDGSFEGFVDGDDDIEVEETNTNGHVDTDMS